MLNTLWFAVYLIRSTVYGLRSTVYGLRSPVYSQELGCAEGQDEIRGDDMQPLKDAEHHAGALPAAEDIRTPAAGTGGRGMYRMLCYQSSVDGPVLHPGVGGVGGGGSPPRGHRDSTLGSDLYLPPFVRRALEEVMAAQTPSTLHQAQESLLRLLPDTNKRHFYQRVFKWVVAFATWKYGEAGEQEGAPPSSEIPTGLGAGEVRQGESPGPASPPPTSPPVKPPGDESPRRGSLFAPGPYVQRQGRSQVAAHEVLKKVQGGNLGARTDQLLQQSIDEYGKHKSKAKNTFT
ncbi:hypothetical protein B484DRAFT_127429 [Ochromonadaceae sp. CCMP2298]|nr:hypothetical protein B484DRAFT_127429 [Ochromonadaceae sp. CCMP2298]